MVVVQIYSGKCRKLVNRTELQTLIYMLPIDNITTFLYQVVQFSLILTLEHLHKFHNKSAIIY